MRYLRTFESYNNYSDIFSIEFEDQQHINLEDITGGSELLNLKFSFTKPYTNSKWTIDDVMRKIKKKYSLEFDWRFIDDSNQLWHLGSNNIIKVVIENIHATL